MIDPKGVVPVEAEVLLYQTEDGRARVEVRFDGETAWLTQAGLAELYQTSPQNITQLIAAIYAERELEEAATCKSYLQVKQEGSRTKHGGKCSTMYEQAQLLPAVQP